MKFLLIIVEEPIWLDKIRPVNIEAYAVNKLLELTSFYDKMMDQDCGLNAVLNPFCYPQHVSKGIL